MVDTQTAPMPKGACDAHFHVFESPERYPVPAGARYVPPSAPLDDYLAQAAELGLERMVFVQPSAYGTDNRCNLDSAERAGDRARVVVAFDASAGDAELRAMHERGARGARINYGISQPDDASLPAKVLAEGLSVARRVADWGWSLDFLAPGWLAAALLPLLRDFPTPYTIAHIGMCHGREGVRGERFQTLLRAIGEGRTYVKLTGIGRLSDEPGYTDLAPMVKALIAANPDRLIWGSDWPHLSTPRHASNAELLGLLRDWTGPDRKAFEKILVENPARLYGFAR